MSQKNIAHDTKTKSHQTNYHSRELLIVAGILFAIGLVAALAAIQSRNSSAASSASVEAVSYNNALALDYAQPYLAANTGVTAEFGDALAMQYAQPYLEAEADAAAMTPTFSDALAQEYARPWLDTERSCNGRLDEMYACQNSR